jgi:hypothetical protein
LQFCNTLLFSDEQTSKQIERVNFQICLILYSESKEWEKASQIQWKLWDMHKIRLSLKEYFSMGTYFFTVLLEAKTDRCRLDASLGKSNTLVILFGLL